MDPKHHPEMRMSITELLLPKAKLYGDRIAMVCSVTGASYSYKQLITQVEHVSSGLLSIGVQKNDVLCLVCHNCPEFTVLSLATLHIGAIVSTANPALTPAELRKQLVDSEAQFVFCSSTNAGSVKSAIAGTSVQSIIVLGQSPGCISYDSLMKKPLVRTYKDCPEVNVTSDTAVLLYSSGTTGLPKGVMLTHSNFVATILQLSHPRNKLEHQDVEQEVFIAALPFFHVFGFGAVQLYGLYKGHKIIYMPKFSLSQYLKLIQEHRATLLQVAPPVVIMIINHPDLASVCDFKSVHTVLAGAASISAEVERAFRQKTGIVSFKQAFGLTESSAVCLSPQINSKPGSVGIPVPGTDVKVIDDHGVTLSPNCPGELCFRGPQVMKGYLKNPEATRKTVDDEGWLHTGDLGYCDTDGFVYVTGRLKELIKYKGYQVSPAELESVLLSHPEVQDVAVIGIPDTLGGELPMAFVVRKTSSDITESTIVQFVKDNVAPYKQLRGGVKFVAAIPKSPSGKILRRVLKQQLTQAKL